MGRTESVSRAEKEQTRGAESDAYMKDPPREVALHARHVLLGVMMMRAAATEENARQLG